jgi:hypothetical protein
MRFNFLAPFGFVSFLDKIYNVAYHYIYKSEFPLFKVDPLNDDVDFADEKETTDFADFFDPLKTLRHIAAIETKASFKRLISNPPKNKVS